MKLDIEKENICANKLMEHKIENLVIEGDIIVPDVKPDIVSSIHTNGNICVYKKEIVDGKIRIDGSIHVNVIYFADTEDGNVRSLNTNLDYSEWIPLGNSREQMDLNLELNLKSMECTVLNGRKINIKAYVEAKIKTYFNDSIEILKDVKNMEEIQRLNKRIQIDSLVGKGGTKTYAKDTLTIDNADQLAEVLKSEIRIINRDFKISYNKILAKAELAVHILYLTEDNRISHIEKQIPIMGFIDIPNISEEHICDINYNLRNIIIKPNDMEEHSIYVEIEIDIGSYVYETKEIDLIQDLYSPEVDLTFIQKKVNVMTGIKSTREICSIKERIEAEEMRESQIYDTSVIPIIQNITVMNGRAVCEGEVNINFLFSSNHTIRVDSRKINLPFQYEMNIDGLQNKNDIDIHVEVKQQNFIILPDGKVDVVIDLELEAKIERTIEINVVEDITSEENQICKLYSMIIYFVKPGDTLWNIAKKFKSTVQDIVTLNQLEDENNIYPGEQLLIPRYVCKNKRISA